MKDKIPEITEIMKKLDAIRDEVSQTNPRSLLADDLKKIVEDLSVVRELMNY